jgi:acetyl esterase/lipase
LALLLIHLALCHLPMPTYELWKVRLVAKELTLAAAMVAALAVLLARTHLVRGVALSVGMWALRPLILAWPLFQLADGSFSLSEYLGGAPAFPVAVERDVVLEPSRPDLVVDIYRSGGRGSGELPGPVVLVVHGGSWLHGDKGEVPQISRALATSGVTVVDVRYRLAPEHRFPASVADVKCVLGRLRQQAGKYGIAPQRAALLGRSAGGQIVLVAAYSVGDAALRPSCPVADEPVHEVIAIYPATDLAYAYDNPSRPDLLDTREVLSQYLGGSPTDKPAAYAQATPMTWVDKAGKQLLPATLLVHGLDDLLVRPYHSQRLYDALSRNGQTVKLLGIPAADHGFDFRSGGIGEQIERAAVIDALRRL